MQLNGHRAMSLMKALAGIAISWLVAASALAANAPAGSAFGNYSEPLGVPAPADLHSGAAASLVSAAPAATAGRVAVPILVYHRFGAAVTDSMTVADDTFAWQLQYLKDRGYTVIPLHDLVDFLRGRGSAPPPRSVVITADDGHRSVYSDMLPLIKPYGFHVTLFIYPSAISNASYALTWPRLAELIHTGLFDVQSHTYWHPNFHQDKKRLAPPQYDAFVHMQLAKSRNVLESRLGIHVDLLAWPFGIYDDDLMARAQAEGYVAALSIERRPATSADPLMELPRYLMTNADRGPAFGELLKDQVFAKERAIHSTAR